MSQTRIKMTRAEAQRSAEQTELLLGLYLRGCRDLHAALGKPFLGDQRKTAIDVFELAIQRLKIEEKLVAELRQFVHFARSWHDFHKHDLVSDSNQCDAICDRIAPALEALANYEATEPLVESQKERLAGCAEEMGQMLLSIFLHVSHAGPTRADGEALLRKAGLIS